jgi:hypothetical protein
MEKSSTDPIIGDQFFSTAVSKIGLLKHQRQPLIPVFVEKIRVDFGLIKLKWEY